MNKFDELLSFIESPYTELNIHNGCLHKVLLLLFEYDDGMFDYERVFISIISKISLSPKKGLVSFKPNYDYSANFRSGGAGISMILIMLSEKMRNAFVYNLGMSIAEIIIHDIKKGNVYGAQEKMSNYIYKKYVDDNEELQEKSNDQMNDDYEEIYFFFHHLYYLTNEVRFLNILNDMNNVTDLQRNPRLLKVGENLFKLNPLKLVEESKIEKNSHLSEEVIKFLLKQNFARTITMLEFILSNELYSSILNKLSSMIPVEYVRSLESQIVELKKILATSLYEKLWDLFLFEKKIWLLIFAIKNRYRFHIEELKNEKIKEKIFNSNKNNFLKFKLRLSPHFITIKTKWDWTNQPDYTDETNNFIDNVTKNESVYKSGIILSTLTERGYSEIRITELEELITERFKNGNFIKAIYHEMKKEFRVANYQDKERIYNSLRIILEKLIDLNILIISD